MTNANYTRFDKQILTSKMKQEILDLISDRDFKQFKNELFGLFDGYLYNCIQFTADADLPIWKKVKLKLITLTIQGY
tara:strand:- start:224 stop:454 length:231 start_codon:yes stop_codon:yes gene_type:complete